MTHDRCSVSAAADEPEPQTESCCAPNLSLSVTPEFSVSATGNLCPVCHSKGKKIDTLTVKAMVTVSLREISPEARYFFCKNPDCVAVYFRGDGAQTFTIDQIREPVFQKTADESAPVCYCFGHTPAAIRRELETTGHSSVADDISAGISAGQCACEIRNPQGSCCLGNVNALVNAIKIEFAPHAG